MSQGQPVIGGQGQPLIVGQSQPIIAGQAQPVIIGQSQPYAHPMYYNAQNQQMVMQGQQPTIIGSPYMPVTTNGYPQPIAPQPQQPPPNFSQYPGAQPIAPGYQPIGPNQPMPIGSQTAMINQPTRADDEKPPPTEQSS